MHVEIPNLPDDTPGTLTISISDAMGFVGTLEIEAAYNPPEGESETVRTYAPCTGNWFFGTETSKNTVNLVKALRHQGGTKLRQLAIETESPTQHS